MFALRHVLIELWRVGPTLIKGHIAILYPHTDKNLNSSNGSRTSHHFIGFTPLGALFILPRKKDIYKSNFYTNYATDLWKTAISANTIDQIYFAFCQRHFFSAWIVLDLTAFSLIIFKKAGLLGCQINALLFTDLFFLTQHGALYCHDSYFNYGTFLMWIFWQCLF